MHLTIDELLGYTDDERAKWRRWFEAQGDGPLKIALAGETHKSVGALILHCFWAELWYARWMRGEIVTEESDVVKKHKDVPSDRAAELFAFGQTAREELRSFTEAASEEEWERTHEFEAGGFHARGSARKLIAHILTHEIRHFAQVAIIVRQQGLAPPGDHDLCFSESFGPLIKKA